MTKDAHELPALYSGLVRAVELMGFDPVRLASALAGRGDDFWPVLALRAVRIEFDPQRAREAVHDLSPLAEAAAQSWLHDVMRPALPREAAR
jgi:hypothetical protein